MSAFGRNHVFKFKSIMIILLVAATAALGCSGASNSNISGNSTLGYKQWPQPPDMKIDVNKKYIATIKTEKGDMVCELFAKDAPKTVNNFVFLAREGFFDNTTFHRVIPGFMAQGGDPTGLGTGGPGYKFDNEISKRKHITGTLSMANSGANTNGSQFFICYTPQPNLDGSYNVFGQLMSGWNVLNRLSPRDPMSIMTVNDPGDKIITITIEEKSQ
jgi:cyclophilin family peptidyl-prolyl cis-trans isomerase